MPLFKTILLPGGILGVWKLSETSEQLSSGFSPEELSMPEFQKYTYEKRRVEWLATRLMLRELIGPDFRIHYTESGKPLLKNELYKFIAISHSREYVAVLVHQQFEVGLDIENIDRNYTAIQKKYLSEAELKQVNGNGFLQSIYWCAKEAIFKMVPEDGIEFREQILIQPFNPELTVQFLASFVSKNTKTTYRLYFQTFSSQSMVWVIGVPETEKC